LYIHWKSFHSMLFAPQLLSGSLATTANFF
jgi:hypothetical protein